MCQCSSMTCSYSEINTWKLSEKGEGVISDKIYYVFVNLRESGSTAYIRILMFEKNRR